MKFSVMLVVCGVLAAANASAATISALGWDNLQDDAWRSSYWDKPAAFDPSGDDAYGTDGYYCLAPDQTVIQSLPAYLSGVTVGGGVGSVFTWAGDDYTKIDDPRLPISGDVADMSKTATWQDGKRDVYNKFFTITLAQDAEFVLSMIVDVHSLPARYGPDKIKVTGPGGVEAEQTGLTRNRKADYVFFQINGNAGDSFNVLLFTPQDGYYYGSSTAGIAFEAVPEPATLILLSFGGLLLRRRR